MTDYDHRSPHDPPFGETANLPFGSKKNGEKHYVTDCSGFIRELLHLVGSKNDDVKIAKDELQKKLVDERLPWRTSHAYKNPHEERPFFRAYDLAFYFNKETNCVKQVKSSSQSRLDDGLKNWARIENPKNLLPGDIVAWGSRDSSASNSGHCWMVLSKPDARGKYKAIQSTKYVVARKDPGRDRNKKGIQSAWFDVQQIRNGMENSDRIYGMGRLMR